MRISDWSSDVCSSDLVASARLAADLPPVRTAADVMNLPLLHEDNDQEWRHWFLAQGVSPPERLPGTRLWHAHLALAAARSGHGVVLSNRLLLGDELERSEENTSELQSIMSNSYAVVC